MKNKEPYYYVKGGFSPIKAFKEGLLTREQYIGFIKGNIIKYVVRCGYKEDNEKDLEKAETYLGHLKEIYKQEDSTPKKISCDINEILDELTEDGWENIEGVGKTMSLPFDNSQVKFGE